MKKLLLFLCASIYVMTCGAAPKHDSGAAAANKAPSAGACVLDAATINGITGLHITQAKDDGEACVYVDPTAPVNGFVQTFGQLLGRAFGGASPVRLPGAQNAVPTLHSGAGIILHLSRDAADLKNVNVHDYAQAQLAQAQIPPEAHCGALQDVSGLNAVSIVCLGGAIADGGVVQNGKLVLITYFAPGNAATDDVMGKLLTAAAAKM